MLKGINKNVIVVNTDKASQFEAVYFVLKKCNTADKADILREANKIIGDTVLCKKRRRMSARSFITFIVAALLGAALSAAVCLLLLF